MNTYKVSIKHAEVSEWNKQEGVQDSNRFVKDVKISKVVETHRLTRKDVIDCVTDMLYLKENYSEDSLFDGNEDFFCIQLLEDEDGYELEEDREDGFLVEYFVDVQKIENIKATDII